MEDVRELPVLFVCCHTRAEGSTSDLLKQQHHDRTFFLFTVTQAEIEGLYKRFRSLDRGRKVGPQATIP